MNIKNLVYAVLLIVLPNSVTAQAGDTTRNYLYKEYQRGGGDAAFSEVAQWKKERYKSITDKATALPVASKNLLLREADKAMSFNWPSLPATLYLEYRDNGNRVNFENAQFERRKVLAALVAGELAGGNGKYLPQIVNGLWLILEESTWVLPAHIGAQKAGSDLPDPTEPVVDLFAGETAATVSWAQFLLHDQLDKFSPIVNKRITYELQQRIITPYLKRKDFWWMGWTGRSVNNWNIWINTNVLQTALLCVNETDIRNKVIEKTIRSADNFVNGYPNDGGCDEGPTYWGHAGGKLAEFIDLLNSASAHRLNWSNNELIHRIGAYIYKMHVDSSRFVNFADASASTIPPAHTVYLYGTTFNDPLLINFAAYLSRLENPDTNRVKAPSLAFFVYNVEYRAALLAAKAAAPYTPENWLPDLQVLSLRSQSGVSKGLFFAAQGGHNAESHNHNDVGNFVLYMDGKPALIDVGVGTYTKQTFSPDRYKLWFMQSQWHNCPTINGVQQQDGRRFQANAVQYSHNNLSMDIAAAYPEAAMVKSWKRTFRFNPDKTTLQLSEAYQLTAWKAPFLLHFMTCLPADTAVPGKVVLKGETANLLLTYDPALFQVVLEQQPVEDARLSPVWGRQVTRISLKSRGQALTGKHTVGFVMSRK
ncbi:heparinase II/III domain-containing protein [Chitinophaga arvensicola]|uniref:Heparinase II/III-like protein n=1 Tax=Chitinophaga arvensicola TaxID=29529 RepID=A0A1I0QWH4_9BACT|nr:heparinase II/III family protein [Chitinophaga arvensicola]SEW31651.1 Heparinase II/III-like protein [Chitinophaga arvensicola]